MCLVARHLEAHGIPTVVLGAADDILNAGQPPRSVFVDYPLGHSAGKPFDTNDQLSIVNAALAALTTIKSAGGRINLPQQWDNHEWRNEAGSSSGDDTRQPRDETPQFQHAADREAAIATGNYAAAG